MRKNELLHKNNNIVRVLETESEKVLIVNCINKSVPRWVDGTDLCEYTEYNISSLSDITGISPLSVDELDNESRRIAYERFTTIAGVLPFIAEDKSRCDAIAHMAKYFSISKQTVKQYLWLYLVYQNVIVKYFGCFRNVK